MVTGKEESSNRLIVAFESKDEPTLWGRRYEIENLSFLMDEPLGGERELWAKPVTGTHPSPFPSNRLKAVGPKSSSRNHKELLLLGKSWPSTTGRGFLGGGTYALLPSVGPTCLLRLVFPLDSPPFFDH